MTCTLQKSVLRCCLFLILFTVLVWSQYPSCGDCWCIPKDYNPDFCPNWQPQTIFSDVVINKYLSQKPQSVYSLLCNPYVSAECATTPVQVETNETSVCAFQYSINLDGTRSCEDYEMITFSSKEEAENVNAVVTHSGACGLCSTTQDLAVYLR
jgi:hypothetical protein